MPSSRSAPISQCRGLRDGRALARQAGARDQHLHLLVVAAPERHRRQDRRLRLAPAGALTVSLPMFAAQPAADRSHRWRRALASSRMPARKGACRRSRSAAVAERQRIAASARRKPQGYPALLGRRVTGCPRPGRMHQFRVSQNLNLFALGVVSSTGEPDGGQTRLQIVYSLDEPPPPSRLDETSLLKFIAKDVPRSCWIGQLFNPHPP
jgi:hypothetical protein